MYTVQKAEERCKIIMGTAAHRAVVSYAFAYSPEKLLCRIPPPVVIIFKFYLIRIFLPTFFIFYSVLKSQSILFN